MPPRASSNGPALQKSTSALTTAPPNAAKSDEKENEDGLLREKRFNYVDQGRTRARMPSLLQQNRTPQTPDRIALSDLVANPEDSLNQLPCATPSEQVTWKHLPGLLDSPSSSLRSTQRGIKRSRSSSPSSSQARKSKHFTTKDGTMDMRRMSQSLQRSPTKHSPNQDDPAAVLWSNYAEKRGNEPVLPPLPVFEPPPHTPGGSRQESPFRRTASCGNEWPTSSSKRRKLRDQDPHSTTRQIFASKRKEFLKPELSKQSRVSILLESVQQNLSARKPHLDEPSSSSPLPERYEPGRPTHPRNTPSMNSSQSPVKSTSANHLMKNGGSPLKNQNDKSSDYGDLDLDDGDLEEIEDALTQGQALFEAANSRVPPKSLPLPHTEATLLPRASQSQSAQQSQPLFATEATRQDPAPASRSMNQLDEFDDDDDDDVFENELQLLADRVESQTAPSALSRQVPRQQQKNGSVGSILRTNSVAKTGDGAFDEDDDVLWDDEIDETTLNAVYSAAAPMNQNPQDNRAIKRYLILEVFESKYEVAPGRKRPEKMLSIKDERSKQLYVLFLRQSWYETRCVKGSFIHLIGNFDRQGQCIVDDNENMIILHPDHLISATVVGDAITCLRRAVLQDRVKATSSPEKPQVYGHILHEVFQEAMTTNSWTMSSFRNIIERVLPNHLEALYEIGVQIPDAIEHLMSKAPLMAAWAEVFVLAAIESDAVIRDRKGALVPTAVNKLLEVEEHIWSPMYGLKGNIDATVQAQLHLPGDLSPKNLVVPLELKTGMKENVDAHRAQTALYTLLLSDRYDVEVTSGILFYMETSKTFRVEGIRNEIRQLIIWRNLLASYVHDKLELPEMIKKEHLCKRCYAQTSCFTYHKLVEGGNEETSGMKKIFDDAVGHLQAQHQAFFQRWDDLLTKEERDSMKFRRELWTMLSTEREQVGRCFSNLVIEPGSAVENHQGPKINRYTYTMAKHRLQPGFSFTESQITVGEPIVISDEQGHFALANGYVTKVRPRQITVAVDRRLQNARRRTKDFNAEKNQSFVGVMEVKIDGAPASSPAEDDRPMLYRLDKDEFSNGMATVRNNLIRVMEKDLFKARDLRQLIIENRPPKFGHTSTAYSLSGPASQQSINVDQAAAIEKVMSARDYALVLGMPGTGKTTTIAHIIRALVLQGKSVLLTSYTHTAVDNILLKIKDDKIPILRLGSVGKVHPEVQSFADLSGIPKKSMEDLERSWRDSKVVATTCLSINHGIFNHRIFDYCIVDEASQITLPVCLGPIRFAHTFILVGDHFQLPPLVQNKEAQEGGLDMSLFKLLSDAQPSSVVNLEHQYRMAADIMLLANKLIYNGRLKCGTASVASRSLDIPNLDGALEAHHHRRTNTEFASMCTISNPDCWMRTAMTASRRVLFLNTDTINAPRAATEVLTGSNSRITNPVESTLTSQLLTALIRSGVPPKSMGVITFYRSQLALIRNDVKATAGNAAATDVEMHTADKYQGRDKEVILLSCVRSNPTRNVGELLKDWRRVNVAITRARSKLVIIGSKSTLEGSHVPVLEGLIQVMSDKKWIVDLPSAATNDHAFEQVLSTQTQPCTTTTAPAAAAATSAATTAATTPKTKVPPPRRTINNAPSNARTPLSPVANRPNTTRPNKLKAPFKQPRRIVQGTKTGTTTNTRTPTKTASKVGARADGDGDGDVDVENLLDARPVLRAIVAESMRSDTRTGVGDRRSGAVEPECVRAYDRDADSDGDGEMLLDF